MAERLRSSDIFQTQTATSAMAGGMRWVTFNLGIIRSKPEIRQARQNPAVSHRLRAQGKTGTQRRRGRAAQAALEEAEVVNAEKLKGLRAEKEEATAETSSC